MKIYKNSHNNRLYLVYKVSPSKHTGSHYICEDYYTKETHTISESGKYSFKTLKIVAER